MEVAMMRMMAGLIVALMLSGCATFVHSDITRVHMLEPSVAGRTFFMLPTANQQGRAEYGLYARDVAEALTAKGMIERPDVNGTDYAVFISYGVGDGQTITSTVPVYDNTPANVTGTVTTTDPRGRMSTSTVSGTVEQERLVGTRTQTDIVYTRTFKLSLVDLAKSPNPGQNMIYAYEGTVNSTGSSGSFMAVSKCMILSLLDDFPGPSGKTSRDTQIGSSCTR
jgi:hypothetical protein